ncbi:MAG: AAA family ATPase [Magnetococcales bacterium]|nr:AAA family ATPase [Magnetococcales bacterium]MBF0438431.1 AAA family ATPase [Magnetococcales bacterium]
MYQNHFNLRQLPFSLTPDTELICFTPSFQAAYNDVMMAIVSGEGFVKVIAEVGTGKTLLCRAILNNLEKQGIVTAYLHNPLLTPEESYCALASELGLTLPEGRGVSNHVKLITNRLLELTQEGKRVVLLADEAQALSDSTLEAIRLMGNLETEKRKIMQVVLFGQPELDQRLLSQPNLRPLRQRIAFATRLLPLKEDEIGEYLNHRLQMAGYQWEDPLFSAHGVGLLYRITGGNPRMVNVLAHKSLLAAFGDGKSEVTIAHVEQAIEDSIHLPLQHPPWWRKLLEISFWLVPMVLVVVFAMLLVVAASLYLYW